MGGGRGAGVMYKLVFHTWQAWRALVDPLQEERERGTRLCVGQQLSCGSFQRAVCGVWAFSPGRKK